MIPPHFRDKNLVIPASWYAICFPARLALAWAVSRARGRAERITLATVLLIAGVGLAIKGARGRNWKDYQRPVIALTAASAMLASGDGGQQMAGAIVAADALVGRTLYHVMSAQRTTPAAKPMS